MPARLLTGREAASRLIEAVRVRVGRLGPAPRLAVVATGGEPASEQYVRSIQKTAGKAGIAISVHAAAEATGFEAFCAHVERIAAMPDVDAVQVQKPIPEGRHTSEVLQRIDPRKDVEGMHPENLGLLMLGRARFVPCTPAAVLALLDHHGIAVRGRRAVVLGRSDIVGKPLASLLLARNATLTVCHTVTADLPEEVARAEILVAAAGSPGLVKAAWLRPGAVVVDVGHHVHPDGSCSGDVEAAARDRADAITPVPGGVGPLTVAALMENVAAAAEMRRRDG